MGSECQICGGAVRRYRHQWLYRCAGCGVLSADLPVAIPRTAEAGAIDEAARAAGLDALRVRNNQRMIETLQGLGAGGRLLDVGCGPGFLLDQAAAAGFLAEGLEPDANVLDLARRRGRPVRQGYFPDALAPAEQFDVIVFNDVLEHIPDLAGALAACAARLSPGGLLVTNCPDRRGLFFRVADALDRLALSGAYDRLWQRGLPSPHVWYFTPEDLACAAARHGFEPAAETRLATISLKGLWRRIRLVRETPLPLALASLLFAWAAYPLSRLTPGDAVVCVFRKA